MSITPLPPLDRTAPTFKEDLNRYFGQEVPIFGSQLEAARVEIKETGLAVTAAAETIDADKAAAAAAAAAAHEDSLSTMGYRNQANFANSQAQAAALTAGQKAGDASGYAGNADLSRQAAQTAAGQAGTAKQACEQAVIDATAQAVKAGAPLVATSTTSIAMQAGPVVLDVGTGKGFAPGQYVVIARTAAPSTALRGLVTGYTNTGAGPLAVTVDKTDGTGGPYAAWTVSVAGRDTVAGARERVLVDTATVTLEHGKDYVLIFAGAVTATMPAAPTWGGASIGLMVANGRTDNAIAWNGANHQGISYGSPSGAAMSIDDPFASFQLVPLNATYGWGIA